MRLTCPNCDAQYEVPQDVIPEEGRDVQCSNCGQTWFQHHPDHMPPEPPAQDAPDLTPAVDGDPDEESVSFDTAPRQQLNPNVSDILKEEAAREAQARAQDGLGLETQPDLGLVEGEDEVARRAREARERMARLRGEPTDTLVEAAPIAAAGSRRDMLPDIDEINSTLRSTSERQITGEEAAEASSTSVRRPRRGGFKRGFMSVVLIAILCTGVYLAAPMLTEQVPALSPALSTYTEVIDQARLWLDVQVQDLLKRLDAAAVSLSTDE